MAENIPRFAAAVLKNCNILAGIAILENAYDETREVIALTADEIPAQEPELLELKRCYEVRAAKRFPAPPQLRQRTAAQAGDETAFLV